MIARVGKKNKDRGGGSGFKYHKRSADDVKKRADQTGGNFDSPVKREFDTWRPKTGENVIRILPPTWDDYDHYGYDVYMHRFIGSDSSNYICLNKMKGKHCPACAEAKSAKDGGEDDEAKALNYQKRCWVWVIDRDDKSETPQVWDMSWSQDRDIAGLSHFKSGKILLIDHPDEGYDIIVKKTGSGLKTKYHFNIERDSSPISDDDEKQEEILNFIQENPIPTTMNFFSAEHIAKKLEGTTEEKDRDLDDDEDKPRKRQAGKRTRDEDEDEDDKPKKKKRPVEEDEDDEDERPKKKKKKPVEEDEDEEETPRRRRRVEDEDEDEEEKPKKKKRPVEEDDEEDERPKKKRKPVEEDEDEEAELPKKKKKRPVEEDEDDEEEEVSPKKVKKRRVEEDEDEEDERPKKKKRPVEEDDD